MPYRFHQLLHIHVSTICVWHSEFWTRGQETKQLPRTTLGDFWAGYPDTSEIYSLQSLESLSKLVKHLIVWLITERWPNQAMVVRSESLLACLLNPGPSRVVVNLITFVQEQGTARLPAPSETRVLFVNSSHLRSIQVPINIHHLSWIVVPYPSVISALVGIRR